jgi:CheY-like chemotaxis protein
MASSPNPPDPVASPYEVLLVEDNPGDVYLLRLAFNQSGSPASLRVLGDGQEAIDYFKQVALGGGARQPRLVLLDLNLPRRHGREVLAAVKGDPALRAIPIVVITSSTAPEDVAQSYDLQANAVVSKPDDYTGVLELVGAIDRFWLRQARPPRLSS